MDSNRIGAIARRQVCNRAGVGHRYLPVAAPPPGDVRIQRGEDHPRQRRRMPADGAPRCTGPGEGLVHKVLRRVLIAHADQDGAEAVIPGSAVKLREVQSLGSHTYSTHNPRARPT